MEQDAATMDFDRHLPVDGWFQDDENVGDYTTGCVKCQQAWPCEVAIANDDLQGAVSLDEVCYA